MDSIIKNIYNFASETFLDFIAPRKCLVCDDYIEQDKEYKYICKTCLDRLPFAEKDKVYQRFLKNFDRNEIALDDAFALIDLKQNEKYMDLVYNLKYYNLYESGRELGNILGKKLLQDMKENIDYLVPVPIHTARLRERAYNQAYYIALGIQEILAFEIKSDIIIRKNYTISQTKIDKVKRKKNVSKAFELKVNDLSNKNILIIDDVLTSGSTINACAKLLKQANANKVYSATIIAA